MPTFENGLLLYQQRNYALAEKELRAVIAKEPGDGRARAILALSLAQLKKHTEAAQEARRAVGETPEDPFAHYAMGHVYLEQNEVAAAEKAAREALRLAPEYAEFHGLLAILLSRRGLWSDARKAAELGLQNDPEDLTCINIHAQALIKQHQGQKAEALLLNALRGHADVALLHANLGWVMLERGQREAAVKYLREALRLDAELEWARDGLLEAVRSRFIVYRWLLQYAFFTSRYSLQARWGMIFLTGGIARALSRIARVFPATLPVLAPVLMVYAAFVFLTWSGEAFFNLLLRLDPDGRVLLTEDEIQASNWVAALLGMVVLGVGLVALTQHVAAFILILVCVILSMLVGAVYKVDRTLPARKRVMTFFYGMLGLGGLSVLAALINTTLLFCLITPFVLGMMFFRFIATRLLQGAWR